MESLISAFRESAVLGSRLRYQRLLTSSPTMTYNDVRRPCRWPCGSCSTAIALSTLRRALCTLRGQDRSQQSDDVTNPQTRFSE